MLINAEVRAHRLDSFRTPLGICANVQKCPGFVGCKRILRVPKGPGFGWKWQGRKGGMAENQAWRAIL